MVLTKKSHLTNLIVIFLLNIRSFALLIFDFFEYNLTGGHTMILRFTFENFLSFKDRTIFNMAAAKNTIHDDHLIRINQRRCNRAAFIFGANASGKSNFLQAAQFAASLINGKEPFHGDQSLAFRLDEGKRTAPGFFQFDFLQNNRQYAYWIVVSYFDGTVIEEGLAEIDHQKEINVFHRGLKEEYAVNKPIRSPSSEDLKGSPIYDIESDVVLDNKNKQALFGLLLSSYRQAEYSNIPILRDIVAKLDPTNTVFHAFFDAYEFIKKLTFIGPTSVYGSPLLLLQDKQTKQRIEALLNGMDTGIESIESRLVDVKLLFNSLGPNKNEIFNNIMGQLRSHYTTMLIYNGAFYQFHIQENEIIGEEMLFNHGEDKALFEYGEESDGTRRLVTLLPIYAHLGSNATYFIDELDQSLHTQAVAEFIKQYYEVAKDTTSQLIATTHDANLLDLNLLRQDEIYFMQRKADKSSYAIPLSDYRARPDKRLIKDYLVGRYGGIPSINIDEVINDIERSRTN